MLIFASAGMTAVTAARLCRNLQLSMFVSLSQHSMSVRVRPASHQVGTLNLRYNKNTHQISCLLPVGFSSFCVELYHSQQGWRNPVNWLQVTPCMFKLGHFWSWIFILNCMLYKKTKSAEIFPECSFSFTRFIFFLFLKMKIGSNFAYAIKI